MPRFLISLLCFAIAISVLSACASPGYDKQGYGGKMSLPKPAKEEVAPQKNTAELLAELNTMKEKGLITDAEYHTKRMEILNKMGQ